MSVWISYNLGNSPGREAIHGLSRVYARVREPARLRRPVELTENAKVDVGARVGWFMTGVEPIPPAPETSNSNTHQHEASNHCTSIPTRYYRRLRSTTRRVEPTRYSQGGLRTEMQLLVACDRDLYLRWHYHGQGHTDIHRTCILVHRRHRRAKVDIRVDEHRGCSRSVYSFEPRREGRK